MVGPIARRELVVIPPSYPSANEKVAIEPVLHIGTAPLVAACLVSMSRLPLINSQPHSGADGVETVEFIDRVDTRTPKM